MVSRTISGRPAISLVVRPLQLAAFALIGSFSTPRRLWTWLCRLNALGSFCVLNACRALALTAGYLRKINKFALQASFFKGLVVPSDVKANVYQLHPKDGFESFITEIFTVIEKYRHGTLCPNFSFRKGIWKCKKGNRIEKDGRAHPPNGSPVIVNG